MIWLPSLAFAAYVVVGVVLYVSLVLVDARNGVPIPIVTNALTSVFWPLVLVLVLALFVVRVLLWPFGWLTRRTVRAGQALRPPDPPPAPAPDPTPASSPIVEDDDVG